MAAISINPVLLSDNPKYYLFIIKERHQRDVKKIYYLYQIIWFCHFFLKKS